MWTPQDPADLVRDDASPRGTELLLHAAREIAAARDLPATMAAVRRAARVVSGADGVTFVLREGDRVHYADEEAIGPLWKGRRFPAASCISGWAMIHRETVVIEDVFADDRIPHDAYRPTFVKSLVMVPVIAGEPVAAIGAYWARQRRATPHEIRDLETLAGLASVALVNARLDAELHAAIRARDEFIAIASHELRTPLAALNLQVERAARSSDGAPDPLRHAIDRARRSTSRLGKLVENLLDVSRLVQNRLELRLEPVLLADLARVVVERTVEATPAARLQLRVEGDPRGAWDRARIEQVLENLLSNAVKFGGDAPIDVRVSAQDGFAALTVADRGLGIAPEDQARIFEPFERAVPTRHFGGFGLGLWIVRQTVEAHGGSIAVESRQGEGSTFTVRLPLAR